MRRKGFIMRAILGFGLIGGILLALLTTTVGAQDKGSPSKPAEKKAGKVDRDKNNGNGQDNDDGEKGQNDDGQKGNKDDGDKNNKDDQQKNNKDDGQKNNKDDGDKN